MLFVMHRWDQGHLIRFKCYNLKKKKVDIQRWRGEHRTVSIWRETPFCKSTLQRERNERLHKICSVGNRTFSPGSVTALLHPTTPLLHQVWELRADSGDTVPFTYYISQINNKIWLWQSNTWAISLRHAAKNTFIHQYYPNKTWLSAFCDHYRPRKRRKLLQISWLIE